MSVFRLRLSYSCLSSFNLYIILPYISYAHFENKYSTLIPGKNSSRRDRASSNVILYLPFSLSYTVASLQSQTFAISFLCIPFLAISASKFGYIVSPPLIRNFVPSIYSIYVLTYFVNNYQKKFLHFRILPLEKI